MDPQQAAQEMQTVERRLQLLDRNLASLEATMEELHAAIATLDGMTGESTLDTRLPIGGGVRVAASVDPQANVVMDVGAGYSTEIPAKDAVARLRERLERTEAAFRSANDDANRLAGKLQQLQAQSFSSSS